MVFRKFNYNLHKASAYIHYVLKKYGKFQRDVSKYMLYQLTTKATEATVLIYLKKKIIFSFRKNPFTSVIIPLAHLHYVHNNSNKLQSNALTNTGKVHYTNYGCYREKPSEKMKVKRYFFFSKKPMIQLHHVACASLTCIQQIS